MSPTGGRDYIRHDHATRSDQNGPDDDRTCRDVCCGTSAHESAVAGLGWTPVGVDLSLQPAPPRRPPPAGRRPWRPARRAGPEVLGRGPPPRRTGPAATIRLRTARTSPGVRAPHEPLALTPGTPFTSRTVFSAAHVVADPYADVSPDSPAAVDWDATLAFRRHLWSHGLGVAEAMDTAQRGMGWTGRARRN
ncbi:hypothetical protein SVIOM74S_09391 [Streptomyces violarus]